MIKDPVTQQGLYLSPIIHIHHRISELAYICLGFIIDPYKHLGKVFGYNTDFRCVPDIDGRRRPFAEVKRTGTLAIENIHTIGSIVDIQVLINEYEVFVEKGAVEIIPYHFH